MAPSEIIGIGIDETPTSERLKRLQSENAELRHRVAQLEIVVRSIGERCAITIPSRFVFKESGYDAMLDRVGLGDRAEFLPKNLSGGQQQRVAIARALVNEPRLLICDEPTTALDVTIQAQIMDLIKKLQKDLNTSVILITHDLGVIADIADDVVVMYRGNVVEKNKTNQIFTHAQHPYTRALLAAVPGQPPSF